MTPTTTSLYDAAQKLAEGGFSVVPVELAKKNALIKWTVCREKILSTEELHRCFDGRDAQTYGVALACGQISGNLLAIDFDNHLGTAEAVFNTYLGIPEVNEIVKTRRLMFEETPSGGYHLWLKAECQVKGNEKLAWGEGIDKDTGERGKKIVIETRGEGGYCLCDPSHGYRQRSAGGGLYAMVAVTEEELDTLLSYARAFSKVLKPTPESTAKRGPGRPANTRPGDEYSSDEKNSEEVLQLFLQAGWTEESRSERGIGLKRPGKVGRGISGVLHPTAFRCFSSNAPAPFDSETNYSLFACFANLKFAGDFRAAARELAKRGLGSGIVPEEEQEGFILSTVDSHGGKKWKIDYLKFGRLMSAEGFRFYAVEHDTRVVRIEQNIVRSIYTYDIALYAASLVADEKARSFLIENEAKLFAPGKMTFLTRLEDDFLRATETTAWLFFKNGAVRVTKGGTQYDTFEYSELPKPVWAKKVLPREIAEPPDNKPSEIQRFLWNAMGQSKARYERVRLAIGYLVHEFKLMSQTKAVIFLDGTIPDSEDDANGGTGKSIVAKFVSHYVNTTVLGGKNLDFSKQFIFQDIDWDKAMLLFDDIASKFPFDALFNIVTGDLTVEKKHQPSFTIPFEKSPKILITTNHSIRGSGVSYERRKYEVEFSSYYNRERTPRVEFGHDLMDDWDEAEWRRADYFVLSCLLDYLTLGLPKDEGAVTRTKFRQARTECSELFFEYIMDGFRSGRLGQGKEVAWKDEFQGYKDAVDDKGEERMGTFTKRLSKLTTILGLKVYKRKSGPSIYLTFLSDTKEVARLYDEFSA